MSNFISTSSDRRIGTVTIDRPERANAITEHMLKAIAEAVEQFASEEDVRVVVLKGSGNGFSSGHDLSGGGELEHSHMGETGIADFERLWRTSGIAFRIWDAPIPVVAQVHGYCLAGAVELVMMCDLAFAAEDARFAMPAIRGIGGAPLDLLYPFYIGLRRTKEFLWLQEELDGVAAADWGLVNRAIPAPQLEDATMEMLLRIAKMPRDNLRVGKRQLHYAMDIIGLRSAARVGAPFDAIAHLSPVTRSWWDSVERHGVRGAIRLRDAEFET